MEISYVLLAVGVIFLIWFMATYNLLVRGRNSCDESWADIDSELKRRYDLIPNLVEAVKGYARHEQATLERVVRARAAAVASTGSPAAQARDENELVGSLKNLFALSENYPDLKANQNFLKLQEELSVTEDRIARARRFYNANVRDYNNRIEMIPSNMVAGIFSFKTREFFEIEDSTVRQAPKVSV